MMGFRASTHHQRYKTTEQRFWEKVDRRGKDECWEWTGFRTRLGYGRFHRPGESQLAHRASWEIHHGRKIPPKVILDHICRNPPCVNPRHLRTSTPYENAQNSSRSLKTSCPNGHPYDVVKINMRTGWRNRRCSICDREYFRQRRRVKDLS